MPEPKLLVVDDEPKNLYAIRRILDLSTLEMVEAHSGQDALRELLHNDFFLILLDIQMPEMSGFEVASLILQNRKKYAQLPIIFMTAINKDEHFVLEGYDIGAVDYIYKPFDPLVLNSKIAVFRELWLRRAQLKKNNSQLKNLNEKLEDTRAKLERSNEELLHISLHDPLTELPNRRYFISALEKAMARTKRNKSHLAVFYLDLDHFKEVNDTLGHDAGDELLVTVAHRILSSVRTGDMVSRLGGDEFVVLAECIDDKHYIASISQHILDAMATQVTLKGTPHKISLSIGIAIYPECGENSKQIMQAADTAMYQAKKSGRNSYRFFSSSMNTLSDEQIRLNKELRRAKLAGEFELYYQPQFDENNGNIVRLEALLRWNHPTKGVVCAHEFISAVEHNGLIHTLGEWVLNTACRQFIHWSSQGLLNADVMILDVNISVCQLYNKQFIEVITRLLNSSAIPNRNLCLDIGENAVSDNDEQCLDVMKKINDMGVGLSIDNFCTGLSCYQQLQRLPINTLKIDRSIIADLKLKSSAQNWVKAIIYMGRALGASVTAKGVEDEHQQFILTGLGVNVTQGFLYARPMPTDELTQFLEERVIR